MSEFQETDEQGFMLTLSEAGKLTVIDSCGGGRSIGYALDEGDAVSLVADYIREMSQCIAEELVEQIEFGDNDE